MTWYYKQRGEYQKAYDTLIKTVSDNYDKTRAWFNNKINLDSLKKAKNKNL